MNVAHFSSTLYFKDFSHGGYVLFFFSTCDFFFLIHIRYVLLLTCSSHATDIFEFMCNVMTWWTAPSHVTPIITCSDSVWCECDSFFFPPFHLVNSHMVFRCFFAGYVPHVFSHDFWFHVIFFFFVMLFLVSCGVCLFFFKLIHMIKFRLSHVQKHIWMFFFHVIPYYLYDHMWKM